MKVMGHQGHRVGIHSTSNNTREGQVRRGLGKQVQIVWSKELRSKAHAMAGEAIAHLLLAKHEKWEVEGKKRFQIFSCNERTAKQAVMKAVQIVQKIVNL